MQISLPDCWSLGRRGTSDGLQSQTRILTVEDACLATAKAGLATLRLGKERLVRRGKDARAVSADASPVMNYEIVYERNGPERTRSCSQENEVNRYMKYTYDRDCQYESS